MWNEECSRIEMHLVSRVDQIVHAAGGAFTFAAGERLHTESCHKFTIESFTSLVNEAGWTVHKRWVSAAPEFAIFSLKA